MGGTAAAAPHGFATVGVTSALKVTTSCPVFGGRFLLEHAYLCRRPRTNSTRSRAARPAATRTWRRSTEKTWPKRPGTTLPRPRPSAQLSCVAAGGRSRELVENYVRKAHNLQ